MNEEKSPSNVELTEGKEALEHVETQIVTSERKVVLKCPRCDKVQDFPMCGECDEPMNFEEERFICSSCGKHGSVPTHCSEIMVPKIV